VRDPADLPLPLPRREPMAVRVDLTTIEVEGRLADGTVYRYWTFNGKVPGPFARVRVGDTVEVNLTNDANSWMTHNVDFHAVFGEHGGGGLTEAEPGQTKSFAFKAMKSGLYVYHCATPMVSQHIASGMYGMILVEPAEGLPPVDREFYVMQGEIYTEEPFGTQGLLTESYDKLMNERPEYFVFNGAVGALVDEFPLKAKVGETVRIFFGVGGPNYTSSFHLIGSIMDAVYPSGSLESAPQEGVQTISVNPGSAVVAEFTMLVPGHFAIVDHALTRAERGLKGLLIVEGPENPEIFRALPSRSLSSVPSATTAA
jgi:nitrite reductase (NO-forming)